MQLILSNDKSLLTNVTKELKNG